MSPDQQARRNARSFTGAYALMIFLFFLVPYPYPGPITAKQDVQQDEQVAEEEEGTIVGGILASAWKAKDDIVKALIMGSL